MDGPEAGASAPAGTSINRDTQRLNELGYAQELKRGMSGFSNFAVSFTIISILSGCLTLFGFGMFTGGPASSAYGWLVVGFFVTFVGLAMAEVCSSYPTAGGSLLLVGEAGAEERTRVGLVHGVVQPARPGRDHGRDRLRPLGVRLRLHGHRVQGRGHQAHPGRDLHRRAGHPRAHEHVRHQAGGAAEQRERVVARGRRAGHLRDPVHLPARPSHVALNDLQLQPDEGAGRGHRVHERNLVHEPGSSARRSTSS